jgi:hypothetical protein
MDVRITVLVVIDPIGDHPLRREIVANEVADQRDVLRSRQFFRQGDDQLAGKLRVARVSKASTCIPECLAGLGDRLAVDCRPQPGRDLIRQRQFLMHQFPIRRDS